MNENALIFHQQKRPNRYDWPFSVKPIRSVMSLTYVTRSVVACLFRIAYTEMMSTGRSYFFNSYVMDVREIVGAFSFYMLTQPYPTLRCTMPRGGQAPYLWRP